MPVARTDSTAAEVAQKKILGLLKKNGLSIKKVAEMREIPYSSVREALKIPGRLTVDQLAWYAEHFGVTADYLLSEGGLHEDMRDIGLNFKMAREGAEVSFTDAQKMLGVSGALLDLIERGEADASVGLLRKAVKNYGVSYDFILGATDSNEDVELLNVLFRDVRFLLTCQDLYRRPILKALFTSLRRLSDDELQKLVQVVDGIINLFLKV
jgi:transcriptional regulator with XRE-family HTH domain